MSSTVLPRRQIRADLLDPAVVQSGMTLSYADWAEDGVDLSEGARVVAGDEDGNTCTATVLMRPGAGGGHAPVVLRLDWSTFRAAPAPREAAPPQTAVGPS